ncbi:Phenylacetic acid catabolic protein [Paraburkholderia sp. HD33-4]|uniref:Phenylacetic acid catabolic protein n=1 Tax=Paraburkholderia sp. HD33-4 TaxID=2883242 RepID=UPI001F4435C1|nr:Phenylacetic acid catabolic protein [Paraburkholderia sp. HD33-4]
MTTIVETPQQLAEMPQDYREVLLHQMLAHTEGELMGVGEYLRISHIAPTALEKMYCYEGARDEMRHYIISAEVLHAIGVDTRYMLEQDSARAAYPQAWLAGKETWAERSITSYLAEWGALEIIEDMARSSYKPWAVIMPEIIADETRHREHGRRNTAELCEQEDGRAAVQRALEFMWPEVLDMFGRSDSKRSFTAVEWGVRQRTNEQTRNDFACAARSILEGMGLVVPPDHKGRKFI